MKVETRRKIIVLLRGNNYSTREIAKRYNVSIEEVEQVQEEECAIC